MRFDVEFNGTSVAYQGRGPNVLYTSNIGKISSPLLIEENYPINYGEQNFKKLRLSRTIGPPPRLCHSRAFSKFRIYNIKIMILSLLHGDNLLFVK